MKFRPNADLMASVFVHLMLLGLIFLYSEVHQFDPVAADTVPVEIVTPQEVARSEVQAEIKPDPVPSPSPTPELQLPSLDKPVDTAKSEPKTQAPAQQPQQTQQQPPQKQATPPEPKPSPAPQHAALEQPAAPPAPQTPPMPRPMAQQATPPSQPAYAQPEPDLSVKYNVMLGLPPDIPVKLPEAPHGPGPGKDNFDAAATEQADVGSSVVAEFRRHLKSCMKLPATLSTGDDVRIKLRVFMKPDGKLGAAPLLIEATASEKGPLLLKSATEALQACQPYAMLPRDRYGEWKVLDLDFTPRDFAS
ncbi:hypothetical protein [Bradyrhizobium embrapense]|uniref:hypothetical protein n=1 Tax=Bradyrhizobium embrapense TaxID=630921 RepID=UPI00067AD8A1|nr:hypothetical protein [Bradyrhizobium embrapense]